MSISTLHSNLTHDLNQMQDNKANSPNVSNTVLTCFVDTWCHIKQNVQSIIWRKQIYKKTAFYNKFVHTISTFSIKVKHVKCQRNEIRNTGIINKCKENLQTATQRTGKFITLFNLGSVKSCMQTT